MASGKVALLAQALNYNALHVTSLPVTIQPKCGEIAAITMNATVLRKPKQIILAEAACTGFERRDEYRRFQAIKAQADRREFGPEIAGGNYRRSTRSSTVAGVCN